MTNKIVLTKLFFALLIITAVIGIYIYMQTPQTTAPAQPQPEPTAKQSNDNQPKVVSIKPDPQAAPVLLPTQTIEITFNIPVENPGEFKHKFDPQFDYEVKISDDRKTIIIRPKATYPLGQGITFIISPETKFDNKEKLEGEVIYHFQTIQYRGV